MVTCSFLGIARLISDLSPIHNASTCIFSPHIQPFVFANPNSRFCIVNSHLNVLSMIRRSLASLAKFAHSRGVKLVVKTNDNSYSYMEHIVSKWDELGVLKRVLEKKLIFIETKVMDVLCRCFHRHVSCTSID